MRRRQFLITGAGTMALAAVGFRSGQTSATDAQGNLARGKFEIDLTEAQWRQRLTPAQFRILRQQGTEPAFSSPLDHETRDGVYACAGCELPLYSSTTKFDSGTGWPSFWKPLPNAIGTRTDTSLFMTRTEVHCRRCGGHLGHVFDDGPPPTGLRYCMNGLALKFVPGKTG
ncbi:MAG: peptide-methionine (R)-S-oxide reductase MsrB [Rhodanobacteraceae bacterium]